MKTSSAAEGAKVFIILPSLRISGGVREALRLADDLNKRDVSPQVLVLWRNEHELETGELPVIFLSSYLAQRNTAALQFPILLTRFVRLVRRGRAAESSHRILFLTHFSTFPFGWVAPRFDWYCFNQDVEWMFVKDGPRRKSLKRLILGTSRRAKVFTTNAYVSAKYEEEGITPAGELSIWADARWLSSESPVPRTIDLVMLLRRGHMKRLDLYLAMLSLSKEMGLSIVIISPDEEIAARVSGFDVVALTRPSDEEIKQTYRRSKIFLQLSDTEGFSLPPLEAMGAGCVPVCRDSGGPRCYMTGALLPNLIPLTATIEDIHGLCLRLLADAQKLGLQSEAAQEIFRQGSALSMVTRGRCLDAMSAAFRRA